MYSCGPGELPVAGGVSAGLRPPSRRAVIKGSRAPVYPSGPVPRCHAGEPPTRGDPSGIRGQQERLRSGCMSTPPRYEGGNSRQSRSVVFGFSGWSAPTNTNRSVSARSVITGVAGSRRLATQSPCSTPTSRRYRVVRLRSTRGLGHRRPRRARSRRSQVPRRSGQRCRASPCG